MQLPPTILSLDKHKKKNKQAKSSEKQRENGPEGKGTSGKPSKPGKGKAPSTDRKEEDATDTNSETDTSSESNSIHGDAVVVEESTAPEPEHSNEPAKKKSSKHSGLRPPRTLETTLFDRLERMYGPGIKRLLNVQYRYAAAAPHLC